MRITGGVLRSFIGQLVVLQNKMYYLENWYNSDEILNVYSKLKNKELVSLNERKANIFNPKFLKYQFNETINYLPVNSYSSFNIINETSIIMLENIIKEISSKNITTLYFPLISKFDLKKTFPNKLKGIYSERLNSYYIDLNKTEAQLKKNISNRNRKNTELDKSFYEFNIATNEEKNYFFELYNSFMSSVGANNSQFISSIFMKEILKLENNFLFCLKVNQEITLMHLIGINKRNENADFVFSASTNNGYYYGYLMLWNEIIFLKSLGFKKFFLGGGVRKNDGIDNFKKRLGGEVLYNGGLKLVVDQENYLKEINKFTTLKENSSFFPIYLKDQIFSKTI